MIHMEWETRDSYLALTCYPVLIDKGPPKGLLNYKHTNEQLQLVCLPRPAVWLHRKQSRRTP